MPNYNLILHENSNGYIENTISQFTDKDDAIHYAYLTAKKYFYLLNPYGNDPDFVDEDGERYQFLQKNKNGYYFMKTKMKGELIIKLHIEELNNS